MSGVLLALGALLALAGVYEMVIGNGDILSERGWSAFIAGAVFVAGGISTIGLALAVRAVDRLRLVFANPSTSPSLAFAAPEPILGHVEPAAQAPATSAVAPAPMLPAIEPTAPGPIPIADPAVVPDVTSPIAIPMATEPTSSPSPEPSIAHAHHAVPDEGPSDAEPAHDRDVDWLDQSFADLEREMAVEPNPPPTQPVAPSREFDEHESSHASPSAQVPLTRVEVPSTHVEDEQSVLDHHRFETAATTLRDERAIAEPVAEVAEPALESRTAALASESHATVAAREDPALSTSPVIGRYESEGTSYVMYADGSIDAQSEAGVYRFASMAELKAFIEG